VLLSDKRKFSLRPLAEATDMEHSRPPLWTEGSARTRLIVTTLYGQRWHPSFTIINNIIVKIILTIVMTTMIIECPCKQRKAVGANRNPCFKQPCSQALAHQEGTTAPAAQ